MIEFGGGRVILRTLEREHCPELWESYELEEPQATEPLTPGLSAEGADRSFEEMQAKQGKEQVYMGIFIFVTAHSEATTSTSRTQRSTRG